MKCGKSAFSEPALSKANVLFYACLALVNMFLIFSANPFTNNRARRKKQIIYGQSVRNHLPPPPYGQLFVTIFLMCFYLRLWFYVFWNGFYTRKIIFIQLQEFPTPPNCRCSSNTKRSDSGIAMVVKALKMHFRDPSQWDKMCFEYRRVIFHWKK